MAQSKLQHIANDWLVRELGGLKDSEQAEFEAWLSADEKHQQAYKKAKQVWALSAQLKPNTALNHSVPNNVTPLPLKHKPKLSKTWLPATAVAAAIAAVFFIPNTQHMLHNLQADHVAAIGAVQTIDLPDGSQVSLSSGSAIDIQYTRNVREVTLLSGEAVFSPRPMKGEETRPFQVRASNTVSKALGTIFHVHFDTEKHQVQTAVLEHSVAFYDQQQQAHDTGLTLSEGEAAQWHANGTLTRIQVDFQEIASWQQGALVFKDETVSDVVATLNRYHTKRLVLLDESMANHKITAVFQLDNLDTASERLSQDLKLNHSRMGKWAFIY